MSIASTYSQNVLMKRKLANMNSIRWQSDQPYNDLPALPPAADLETKQVLRSCIEARAALGELKQATELIPNPSMLINTLPLLEALKTDHR
jgi:hypothetical protein